MIVPILKYGSPILRKHSTDVTLEDNLIQLSENLFETLKRAGGIGLAAPQAGILKRAFVIDTTPIAKENCNIEAFEKLIINPEIIWQSKKNVDFKEGCLSIPGINEDISRPEEIVVVYYDTGFNIVEEGFNGIKARIFQHEYDHLEGILFVDKLNPLKRKLLSGKLNNIKNNK